MKIEMNKNFEEAFRVTVWKGLTTREVVTGAIALAVSFGSAVLLWWFTEIPINLCVYAGMPLMLLIGGLGIYQYQGMTVFQMLKEIRYMAGTRELAAEAQEHKETARVFTMQNRGKRK